MWILTVVVALIGVLIAIISFFKNRRFFWRFKNEKDLVPKKGEVDELDGLEKLPVHKADDCGTCDNKKIDEFGVQSCGGKFEIRNDEIESESEINKNKYIIE